MVRRFLWTWVVLFIASCVTLLIIGCTADQIAKAKQSRDAAQVTVNATTQAVAELKADVAAMPADAPGRDKVLAGIAKGEKIIADAQKAVDTASAAIKSVETGQLDPALTGSLAGVPYGSYIALAATLGFGLYKTVKASNLDDALTKVVHSWEAVGTPLSDSEKAAVAGIQGPDVTALVHEIKSTLAG
jgi:hypothetical protein